MGRDDDLRAVAEALREARLAIDRATYALELRKGAEPGSPQDLVRRARQLFYGGVDFERSALAMDTAAFDGDEQAYTLAHTAGVKHAERIATAYDSVIDGDPRTGVGGLTQVSTDFVTGLTHLQTARAGLRTLITAGADRDDDHCTHLLLTALQHSEAVAEGAQAVTRLTAQLREDRAGLADCTESLPGFDLDQHRETARIFGRQMGQTYAAEGLAAQRGGIEVGHHAHQVAEVCRDVSRGLRKLAASADHVADQWQFADVIGQKKLDRISLPSTEADTSAARARTRRPGRSRGSSLSA